MCYTVIDDKISIIQDSDFDLGKCMGLGTALGSHIEAMPEYAGLRGILITRDAHDLYRKYGYEVLNDRVMVKSLNC